MTKEYHNPDMAQPAPYLTTKEAADLLRLHPGTLSNWRAEGRGPSYLAMRGGRILYSRAALEAWLEGFLVETGGAGVAG